MSENTEKEIVKEIAKSVYEDAGQAIAKPTGELVGLIPRAIKAALAPVEKWVMQREYNLAETKKLLEYKLQNIKPELIEPPEPYVAVPALQSISYCMDNNELREMYANLLANSMISVVKNGVHPGFVEIIKQLCPDEAKILRYIYEHKSIPTITLRWEDKEGSGFELLKNFSNVGELTGCETPFEMAKYFDNLIRLGLINSSGVLSSLTNKDVYAPLKEHSFIEPYKTYTNESDNAKGSELHILEGFMRISEFGKAFCYICLDVTKMTASNGEQGEC
ncbi:MAG: DUF4393 domain-containing protein [Clostridia bacterium]|nr:DUF4393 domain-containing protein [Clostridia bacterium]